MSKVQIGSKSNVKLAPTTKDVQKSYFLREVQVKSDQDNWASVTINNKRGRKYFKSALKFIKSKKCYAFFFARKR